MQNQKNNIILMTDAYKFSHHKQYPVSWMPAHARPTGGDYQPPVLFPAKDGAPGTQVLRILPVPCDPNNKDRVMKMTIVTAVSTAVVDVQAGSGDADLTYDGNPVAYAGAAKSEVVIALGDATRKMLNFPDTHAKVKFANVDEAKLKRGSALNATYEGGYNVSYYTPRAYNEIFDYLTEDNIVFFGLQYFMKEYLLGEVVTSDKIEEADAFIARYMADVRMAGPIFESGYDYTMFPRGDWEAMVSGDYDGNGKGVPERKGVLPIRIEALPEGTCQEPGVCSFKITNTHPRFFWLPNFLETLLVQVWYPMSVATQSREFRKFIQAYSILSQRESQVDFLPGQRDFNEKNIADDDLSIHIAQVFDLLDFGYRGVSSHETAGLGAASYYTSGYEGSDTVAGSRMLLRYYNHEGGFNTIFENLHGATSVPAAEHSTITSWADCSATADHVLYQKAEYSAFCNMIKQYMPSFCISLVSDGFNIWNAITNLWSSEDTSNGVSMRGMLAQRLKDGQLNIIRPDSGEGVETLPQLLTVLELTLNEHWQKDVKAVKNPFDAKDPYAEKYNTFVNMVRKKRGLAADANPFRRPIGQQLRVLQGDGVALTSLGDMLASMVANGFCANCANFGSGGGLLQKLNRDSVSVAFKCCAMYVGDKCFPVGKDPIAGGKKSYGGNPPVIRGPDGVLRNRGKYSAEGEMIEAEPMTVAEFRNGAKGDELKKVFENGAIVGDQSFVDIKKNAAIKKVDATLRQALDNLILKTDFLQRMTNDEAIAVRLAEASVGSKWKHTHPTTLGDLQAKYPKYDAAFAKLGITKDMDSAKLVAHLKTLVVDKKDKKKVLRALEEDEVDVAAKAWGAKVVLTM
jgi:nicotinamide phosphoribosyltransferase